MDDRGAEWEAYCTAQDAGYERLIEDARCLDCSNSREFDKLDGTDGRICLVHMFELGGNDNPKSIECWEFEE